VNMPWWDVFTGPIDQIVDKAVDGLKQVGEAAADLGKSVLNKAEDVADGDAFFPGNADRQRRAEELARDCTDLSGALTVRTAEIDKQMRAINAKIAKAFKDAMPSALHVVIVKVDQMQYQVTQVLQPLVTSSAIAPALLLGTTALLATQGTIPAGALDAMLAVTGLYSFNLMIQGGPATIALMVGIGALSGAQRRDALRNAIHKGIAARRQLAHALVVNGRLAEFLSAASDALDVLNDVKAIKEADLIAAVNNIVDKQIASITKVSDTAAAELLVAKDKVHNSWTDEDS